MLIYYSLEKVILTKDVVDNLKLAPIQMKATILFFLSQISLTLEDEN